MEVIVKIVLEEIFNGLWIEDFERIRDLEKFLLLIIEKVDEFLSEVFSSVSIELLFSVILKRFFWDIWVKGEFFGSGIFGLVYEGVVRNGMFFVVKEVNFVDEGKFGR